MTRAVAAGNGDVLVIVRAAFTGKVNIFIRVLLRESVTVTLKVMGVAVAALPIKTPAELTENVLGRPVADHVYTPEPPEAVKVSM